MNILVIGGGGREHAIGWRISKDGNHKIFFSPGNGGTRKIGENFPLKIEEIKKFVEEKKIELVVIGPENPLRDGIVDLLEKTVKCFGPKREQAKIETSKVYAKKIMEKKGIPTADFKILRKEELAKEKITLPKVIKADGLCAGKGTFVVKTEEELKYAIERIVLKNEFGEEANFVVVEDYLEGEEASYFAVAYGKGYKSLCVARDFKRLLDGDKGPNTGGMGAYSPTKKINEKYIMEKTEKKIIEPLLEEIKEYKGIIYVGLMIKFEDIFVLEFNARFGDPEAQVILPRFDGDFVSFLMDVAEGREPYFKFKEDCALGVVMASPGYPENPKKGLEINIGEEEGREFVVFHSGTELKDGKVYSTGGRVLTVVGIGESISVARERAYKKVFEISEKTPYLIWRKDIDERI